MLAVGVVFITPDNSSLKEQHEGKNAPVQYDIVLSEPMRKTVSLLLSSVWFSVLRKKSGHVNIQIGHHLNREIYII